MKVSTDQKVFIKNPKEGTQKYWCEGCAFFIQGIGNWGGCAVVAPELKEADGLHIHRKSSCKYWVNPPTEIIATPADVNEYRFSKGDSLYGINSDLQVSPLGFACKNCEYWIADGKSCQKFEGVEINADDCSDGWHPTKEALARANKYDDQVSPQDEEEAKKFAAIYGPNIGEELRRSLTDGEVEQLINCVKSKDGHDVEVFYEAFKERSRTE